MNTRRVIPTHAEIASGATGPLPRRVRWASQILWSTPLIIGINAITPWIYSSHSLPFTISIAIAVFVGFLMALPAIYVVRRWRPASPQQISDLEGLITDSTARVRLARRIEAGMTFVAAAAEIDRLSLLRAAADRERTLARLRSGETG